jgi:hypothetical protein
MLGYVFGRVGGRFLLPLVLLALAAFALPSAALAGNSLRTSVHHYDFGEVSVGTSAAASFTFTNVGSGTIRVGEIHSSGFVDKGALDFDLDFTGLFDSPSCFSFVLLAPGDSCTLSFSYTPTAIGRGWLHMTVIATDGSGVKIVLAGTGV